MDDKKYKTHWHSFWFGFMSALAVVLFFLLIGTITNKITINSLAHKKTAKLPTENNKQEEAINDKSLSIEELATKFKINKEEFKKCMDEKRFEQKVKDDLNSGHKALVKGTPHSFVFFNNAIYEIPGAYSEEGMRQFFDDLLAGRTPKAEDISNQRDVKPVQDTDWIRGDESAKITVITYTDVECPYCKKFHQAIKNIMQDYPKDVKWIFRHMPSDRLHPTARTKAEAAECIGEIGGAEKFWEFTDYYLQ